MNEPSSLTVNVSQPYPIYFGEHLHQFIAEKIQEKRLVLISDDVVAPLYADALANTLKQYGKTVSVHIVPNGEESKSSEMFARLLSELARENLDRKSAVLALGGGVVGDLAGFVAASYMRGIAFYQIPTNVLSMVDSSVGGKTGINLAEGKNLVGAFWQPQAVFMDIHYLRTVPGPEFRGGAVELFKHGLLADPTILDDVENAEFNPEGSAAFLQNIIGRSVKVKADIVAQDEKEQNIRAYLNLGHTLAHALESATHHDLTHGEAVAYGLVFDAYLAKQRGYADETGRCLRFLRWMKPKPSNIQNIEVLEPYMLRDKKNEAGKVKFVILEAIGKPMMVDDVTVDERARAWDFLKGIRNEEERMLRIPHSSFLIPR
ncbi:MAG: 3-dehydroquinate synthase [Trueperaceae bacterium]